MSNPIRDVYNALTLRNTVAFSCILAISITSFLAFDFVVWRRFPIPMLILSVAFLGWQIGRLINHAGLSHILNAASAGLGCFGLAHCGAAIIDSNLFPVTGYCSWTVHMTMWGWILFHVTHAWKVLKSMPQDNMTHVTAGTEAIYAQMTYREVRSREAREAYETAKRKLNSTIPHHA